MEYKGNKLAYMAGVLDGDGSFSLIKRSSERSPLYFPMVQLANVSASLIELFRKEFGGSVRIRKPYVAADGHARQQSIGWKVEKKNQCAPTIDSVVPYLQIKKERAEYLLDFCNNHEFKRGCGPLSIDTLFDREKSYLKMRKFNDFPCINGELFTISKRIDNESEEFWSYVAGIMDTDGSFSLKRENRTTGGSKSPVFTSSILLTQTDCRAIYYLVNNFFGGNLMTVKSKSSLNGFCYRFSITSKKIAVKFLQRVIPYLLVKKDVAQELLNFCLTVENVKGGKLMNEEQLLMRNNYYLNICHLNKYGVYKSSLMDLKPLPDNAEGNKAQAESKDSGSVNVASGKTFSLEKDAVL